jgi:hypothetical protein
MIPNEVFVNYYNFNPIWVQHASIHGKKYTKMKKVIVKASYKKFYSWSRKKYLPWIGAGVGAERNIFGSAILVNSNTENRLPSIR